MSGRRGKLSSQQQIEIGAAVLEARVRGECWKDLEKRFDRDRTQLWRYARAARPGMQHLHDGMQHHADCAAPRAA